MANFESNQGSIFFDGKVNGAGNKLVVSAAQQIRFDDEVGVSFVGPAPDFELLNWTRSYRRVIDNNLNPTAVDVLANTIRINANIVTKGPQLYKGSSIIGSPQRDNPQQNSTDRILLSLNPSITFDGPINDSNGTHKLTLRAISLGNETPKIAHGDIGQLTALRGFDAQVGSQDLDKQVAFIIDDRFRYKGEITIGGSVRATGDIVYKAGDVEVDSLTPVTLRSGTLVSIETGLTPQGPKSMVLPEGQSISVSLGRRGQFINGTGTPDGSISLRRDPPPATSEQTGSGMVSALKRSIDRIQTRQPGLDEILELNGLASAGGEVSIGALQDVSGASMSESLTPGAVQIDCSEQAVAMANTEQCSTTNPN
jgi:hypothetical protein